VDAVFGAACVKNTGVAGEVAYNNFLFKRVAKGIRINKKDALVCDSECQAKRAWADIFSEHKGRSVVLGGGRLM